MPATPKTTEILLRVNLAAGLSPRELAQIRAEAGRVGGMEPVLIAAIRRGLAARAMPPTRKPQS